MTKKAIFMPLKVKPKIDFKAGMILRINFTIIASEKTTIKSNFEKLIIFLPIFAPFSE